jgi:hypothetical protein
MIVCSLNCSNSNLAGFLLHHSSLTVCFHQSSYNDLFAGIFSSVSLCSRRFPISSLPKAEVIYDDLNTLYLASCNLFFYASSPHHPGFFTILYTSGILPSEALSADFSFFLGMFCQRSSSHHPHLLHVNLCLKCQLNDACLCYFSKRYSTLSPSAL